MVKKKNAFLIGDYNINTLDELSCKSKQRQDFINLMASYSYNKLIGFPTRVIKDSSTFIDNIYSNMPNVYDTGTSGVLNNMRCSDHLPIFTVRSTSKFIIGDTYRRKRNHSMKNTSKFKKLLKANNWEDVYSHEDAQSAFTCLINFIIQAFNESCPMETIIVKCGNRHEWINNDMKAEIKERERLLINSKKYPKEDNIRKYKKNSQSSALKSKESGSSINYETIGQCIYYTTNMHMINLSIVQGDFPDEMKLAKVLPIYKSENGQLVQNYRPISVLPYFSKIYERVIYNHFIDYIDDNKTLYDKQFGFRKRHSTSHAIITLVEKVAKALDTGKIVVGAYLDIRKAFDCVRHHTLLDKLYKIGIRGNMYCLIENYLMNRTQYVHYNGCDTSTKPINIGAIIFYSIYE